MARSITTNRTTRPRIVLIGACQRDVLIEQFSDLIAADENGVLDDAGRYRLKRVEEILLEPFYVRQWPKNAA